MLFGIIVAGSYLVFPCILLIPRLRWLGKWRQFALLILCGMFVWMRFVEPYWIVTRNTTIKVGFSARLALVADLHLGQHKKAAFLKQVVNRVNESDVDFLLIAGDFCYRPDRLRLAEILDPLKQLKVPAFAVLGNHDVQRPGPPIRQELAAALEQVGVRLLNNESARLGSFTLLGLGDHWNCEDDVRLIDQFSTSEHLVVMTHNPDTTMRFTDSNADLTLCGHTHGGQVRIPFLYQSVIPTRGSFDRGLMQLGVTQLFVTSGLGEVGFPLRLFNPPVIDLLELK